MKAYDYFLKYRLIWFSLVAIILYGFLIRYWAAFDEGLILGLSEDDFGHVAYRSGHGLSYSRDLATVFFRSYQDVHPPLRNLILNLILAFVDDIHSIRLVSFIPGVLLMPASFLFGYAIFLDSSIKVRFYSGLICTFLIASMETLILLSIETRPYSLMFLFEILAFTALIFAIKKNSYLGIFFFSLFSILCTFTNYSSLIPVAVMTAVLIFNIFKQSDLKSKLYTALGSVLLSACVVFHYFQLQQYGSLKRFTDFGLSYIRMNYLSKLSEIPVHFLSSFKTFFSSPNFSVPSLARYVDNDRSYVFYITLLVVFCLLGLIYLLIKKQYLYFFLSTLTIVLSIMAAFMKLAPFGAGRQNLYLLPFFLIPMFYLYAFLLQSSFRTLFKFLLIVILLLFPWSQGLSLSITKSINGLTVDSDRYLPSVTKVKTLSAAAKWLLWASNKSGNIIFVSDLLNTRIRNHVFFTKMEAKSRLKDKKVKLDYVVSNYETVATKRNVCIFEFIHREATTQCINQMKKSKTFKTVILAGLLSGRDRDLGLMKKHGFSLQKTIFMANDWYRDLYSRD